MGSRSFEFVRLNQMYAYALGLPTVRLLFSSEGGHTRSMTDQGLAELVTQMHARITFTLMPVLDHPFVLHNLPNK